MENLTISHFKVKAGTPLVTHIQVVGNIVGAFSMSPFSWHCELHCDLTKVTRSSN